MAFKLQAKHLFLTYAQCPLELDLVYDYLLNIRTGSAYVRRLCVAQESHEDEGRHFHAYLEFSDKPCIRNPRFFDIQVYHPNIQKVKSTNDTLKYVTKDGVYKANFHVVIKYSIEEILERASDEKSYRDMCLVSFGIKFAASYSNYMKLFRDIRTEVRPNVYPAQCDYSGFRINDLNLLVHLTSIIAHNKRTNVRTKSVWLWGPSKTGKTSLARSLGKHGYIHEEWNADNFSDEADYMVFDDIDWEVYRRRYKSFFGCMKDITITDKYRSKKNLYYSMPAIICTNELPDFSVHELDWLNHNVVFIKIENRLY